MEKKCEDSLSGEPLVKNEGSKSKKLESPFTWLDLGNEVIDVDYKSHVEEDEIPALKLMRLIIDVFTQVKMKKITPKEMLESFKNCDEQMKLVELQRPEQFSINVIKHVLEATKYFAYLEHNMKTEANEIYRQIETVELHRGTLNGLKSVFWSKFHRFGREKSADFAKNAIIEAPRCDMWYFVLGKSLRRIRRDTSFGCKPSKAEIDAFKTAYDISKNILYGLFVAQSYKEGANNSFSSSQKSLKFYEELYRTVNRQQDPNIIILLRLALGFIRLRNFRLAEECLNKVEDKDPQDLMFLHYKGVLCLKKKNYNAAAYYMREAAAGGNVCAARQYIQCMQFVDPNGFDPAQYLTTYVKESKQIDDVTLQNLYLDIATSHMMKTRKTDAFEYYLKAIEINPESKVLTAYYSAYKHGENENIYELLTNFFKITDGYDCGSVSSDVQKLKEYCKKYFSEDTLINNMGGLKV